MSTRGPSSDLRAGIDWHLPQVRIMEACLSHHSTSTMSLLQLPNELIQEIIKQILPDGFESLALTCKELHSICKPFIPYHNSLCKEFGHFTYRKRSNRSFKIRSSIEFLLRIAVEPVVALYVREADLQADGLFKHRGSHEHVAEDRWDALYRLLENSQHIQEANLSCEIFYGQIEADYEEGCYSQLAAAFLLTLLPNTRCLTLPTKYKYYI